MTTAAKLKVFLAGRVALESDGVVIEEDRFPGRQGRLLFAYLVAEQGRPVPRDELADALWGEAPPATSDKALTVLASKLRSLLTGGGIDGANALTSAFGSYRLNLPEGTWVDIVAAADALQEAEAALAAEDFDHARVVAEDAASLARRSFLPDEEGAWVEGKRRELTEIVRRALSCLTEASLRSGDAAEAAHWAEDTIALDPYRETGYRQLMAAHSAAGNRAEALRVYEQCRQLLATELGAYPSPETESIYRELLEAPSPSPQSGGATAGATPVAVVERESPGARPSAPVAVPRHVRRRRRLLVGALAGMIAAVAIPLFAHGRGSERVELDDSTSSIGVLDADSGDVTHAVELEAAPTAVAAGGNYIWAASADSDFVFAIDPKTNTVRQRIDVEGAPGGLAVGAHYVWVTNSLTGRVSQIDPEELTVVQSIQVGNGPTGIAVQDGYVWVANTLDHTVSKIRARSGKEVGRYHAGTDPTAIDVGAGAVWVASKSNGTLTKLDQRNGQLLRKIDVGNGPAAVKYGLGSVWVANSDDRTVVQIDPASGSTVHTTQVDPNPSGIAIVRGEVWTTSESAGTVSRIDPDAEHPTTVPLAGRPTAVAALRSIAYVALRSVRAPHRGGTLTVVFDSEPLETLDVAVESLNPLAGFHALTNDTLLTYRHAAGLPGTELVPDLALSNPEVSPNGKTYTFQLRPNIRYSTGAPVTARDVRYTIERELEFGLHAGSDAPSFAKIVGADRCGRRHCDLSAGIQTDDPTGRVTFHLSTPDPDFRYKLASQWAAVVPAGTSRREAKRQPLPATGPYRIASFTGRVVRLVRNPYFREWSPAAQPAGFPDEIVLKTTSGTKNGIALVEHGGRADLIVDTMLGRFQVPATSGPRKHVKPDASTVYLALNSHTPPFDNLRARRALNYAVDRGKVVRLMGAEDLSRPTCQMLPPNLPAYHHYCPYTLGSTGDGGWTAPDLTKARQLVKASGTAGTLVRIWAPRERLGPGSYVREVLKALGYRVRLRSFHDFGAFDAARVAAAKQPPRTVPQIIYGGWVADFPTPSGFLRAPFRCGDPANYTHICDPELKERMSRAAKLERDDPEGAIRLWADVDREITHDALVVPLINGYNVDLASRRVGNYQYNPQMGVLLSQLWVR